VNVFAPRTAEVVRHENPVPLVYCSALFVVLQLGTDTAVGEWLEAVALATTVFAACAGRFPNEKLALSVPRTVRF
jgi:hypothetical protein